MKKHYRHENDCLNCGTLLDGRYCPNCGQENLEIKENFGHLMNHAISDYFHFDHQFIHTLKPLLFQPGKLTNEYMAGRRVQYLHPIKMYIFISLVFFVLFFKQNHEEEKKDNIKKLSSTEKGAVLVRKLDANPHLTRSQKTALEALARNAPEGVKIDTVALGSTPMFNITTTPDSVAKKPLESSGSVAQTGKINVNVLQPGNKTVKKSSYPHSSNTFFSRLFENSKDSTYAAYLVSQQKLPATERDGFFKRMAMRKAYGYKKFGNRARDVFMEELNHNIPKMMFVLLPLFALILRFAFWGNKKYYVEHLIFSFHLHCFVFLLLTIIMLANLIPDLGNLYDWLGFLGGIAIIIYIYKAFRAVYHRSRLRTISKMAGVSFVYLMAFTVCMLVFVLITAVTAV